MKDRQSASDVPTLVRVTDDALSSDEALAFVSDPRAGGICLFLGVVRNQNLGREVTRLHYESYASMAEKEMRSLVREASSKWPICKAALLHRTGTLEIGEASVLVAVSAPHRVEVFPACRYLIDRLKEQVPIWKKEFFEGGEVWIEESTPPDSSSGAER